MDCGRIVTTREPMLSLGNVQFKTGITGNAATVARGLTRITSGYMRVSSGSAALLGWEIFVIFPGDGCAYDGIPLIVLIRSIYGLIHGLASSLIAPFSPLLRSSDGLIGGSLTRTRFIIHAQRCLNSGRRIHRREAPRGVGVTPCSASAGGPRYNTPYKSCRYRRFVILNINPAMSTRFFVTHRSRTPPSLNQCPLR